MATNSKSTHLEQSLVLSIDHYRAVLQALEQISQSLSSNESILVELVHSMADLQQRAQQHDESLLVLLTEAGSTVSRHPLYLQRLELIQQVIELNHLLLPKINGMMALVSHELVGLKNGRAVLGGYKQNTQKQGRLVKSSA